MNYIPQLLVSQLFMPIQASAKHPNPTVTDTTQPKNVKKAKLSREIGLLAKGRPGPVAAIFAKAKPVPIVSSPEPQHALQD